MGIYIFLPLGCVGGSFVGLGPLKDICRRGWALDEHVFSNVEFRLVNNAEVLGFNVLGSLGGNVVKGKSLLGGNGGGEVPSLGGSIGAFGACRACYYDNV